jgi:serine protease Do
MWRLLTRKNLKGLLAIGVLAALTAAVGMAVWENDARAQSSSRGGYLGVVLQDMNDELRESYGYQATGGVLISDLDDGGPADQAGMKRGDILIRFKGRSVESTSELSSQVSASAPGETATVVVWRNGRERAFKVELGSRSGSERRRIVIDRESLPDAEDYHWVMPDVENWRDLADDIRVVISRRARLGVRTQDLSEQLGEYFGVRDGDGVLVTEVIEDTPAERAGLRAGDVILEVDGENVEDSSELREELSEKDAGEVRLTILRQGSRHSLTAELEKPREPRYFSYEGHPRHKGHSYRWRTDRDRHELHLDGDMGELREELRELQRELLQLRREIKDLESERNYK